MRVALAVFLLLHGLAHLVGFLAPWAPLPERSAGSSVREPNVLLGGHSLSTGVARGLSVLWLAGAAAFSIVAYGLWQHTTWSPGALIAILIASLVITLVWWPSARIGAGINAALLLGLVSIGIVQFRREMSLARARVLSRSTMITMAAGAIEYADVGQGRPILALHGTAGGWDQAIGAGTGIIQYGYRLIAPSRFGYLRTPWRADASPALEADTWAMLLDSLGIGKVAVMSWSAGTAPAVQFALRHPDRVSKLVLFVPGAGGVMKPPPGPPPWLVGALFKSNFPIWAAQQIAPTTMLKWVAVPVSLLPSLADSDRALLAQTIEEIFPVDARHDGMVYDARSQSGAFGLFQLARISAPTLWISAEDDLYGTIRAARYAASVVPAAKLITYDTGGHLLLGRGADLWPRVAAFLKE